MVSVQGIQPGSLAANEIKFDWEWEFIKREWKCIGSIRALYLTLNLAFWNGNNEYYKGNVCANV